MSNKNVVLNLKEVWDLKIIMHPYKYEIPNTSTVYETPAIETRDQFQPPGFAT